MDEELKDCLYDMLYDVMQEKNMDIDQAYKFIQEQLSEVVKEYKTEN